MRKLYFDNESITAAIVEYNRQFTEEGKDNIVVIYPFTNQIQLLVRGVINTHKIYRWWNDVDELVQEGMVAVYTSLRRFNPEKGTAFNYLSIVAKQHLKNWTQQKNKKKFLTSEYNDELYQNESDPSLELQDTMALQYLFLDVEVHPDLEKTLEAISNAICKDKIFNKRDVVKQLSRAGYEKKNISAVFIVLENHFGEMNG